MKKKLLKLRSFTGDQSVQSPARREEPPDYTGLETSDPLVLLGASSALAPVMRTQTMALALLAASMLGRKDHDNKQLNYQKYPVLQPLSNISSFHCKICPEN